MSKKIHNIRTNLLLIAMTIAINLPLHASANGIISEIKNYIKKTNLVFVEFEQINYEGQLAKRVNGVLIIDKPNKFRCNYFYPFPLLIVGNKSYISIYDYEMNSLIRVNARENPFAFLLADDGDFQQELELISAQENNSFYYLKTKHKKTEKINEIAFDKKTGTLKYLKIFEGRNSTEIYFKNTQYIKQAKNDLFILKEPRNFGKPARLDLNDLKKKVMFKLN